MLKMIKLIGFFGAAVLLFVGIYLASAFILSHISIPTHYEKNANIDIYIRMNSHHSDFLLPVQGDGVNWNQYIRLSSGIESDSSMHYIGFGWGDRDFYMNTPSWSDLKFSTAFKALFGFGESAIHIRYYQNVPTNAHKLKLSPRQYSLLVKYIEASFRKNKTGDYIQIKDNSLDGKTDAFYEATGKYSLFNTCNTWINRGLKKGEQQACLWTPFEQGISIQEQK
jgi:uncharacterized protein (TIGR02117 family)